MIRVLIADDHQIVRDGLRGILAGQADFEIAGEAANGDDALALVRAHDYDVGVIDMSMPGIAGIDLIKHLKREKPALRILVLSMHGEQQYAARALKAGASGYLNKDSAGERLVAAVRRVAGGGLVVSDTAAAALLDAGHGLTDREADVLRLLAAGSTPTEAAAQLHLSVKTVSTHKANLQAKLGVSGTAELVRYAIEHKLI